MSSFLSRILSIEKEYRTLSRISIGGLLFTLGTGVVWFILPILAEKLFKDLMIVGLLIAIPSIISLSFDIPIGGLSDRIGRKKLFLGGLIVMSSLGLLLPSINTFTRFILFMILFGLANLSIIVPSRAYIMDIAPKGKTSEFFGISEAAQQIGFAIAPVIGGYFIADRLGIGLLNTGLFFLLMSLIAAMILLLVKETVTKEKPTFVSIKDVITKDKVFLKSLLDYKSLHYAGVAIFLSTFIIVFIDGIVWTFGPLYTTLGVETWMVGLILSMFVLPFILFEVPAGIIADKFSKITLFVIGLLLAGVFLILFGSTQNSMILIVSAFVATTGLAFARPAMEGFLTDISAKKEHGSIVGVWDVAEDSAYAISPLIGGIIANVYGIGVTFMLLGGSLIVLVPFIYLAIRKSKF